MLLEPQAGRFANQSAIVAEGRRTWLERWHVGPRSAGASRPSCRSSCSDVGNNAGNVGKQSGCFGGADIAYHPRDERPARNNHLLGNA